MFGVTILGNNSALPAYDRHPTAQIVTLNDQLFLIDCGEGTQMQLSRYKIRRSKISHIFISHLHGDHYFGLPGLLTSFSLMNREQDLHLHAPEPLKRILELQFSTADTRFSYKLLFHALGDEGVIVDDEKFTVETFKVFHRIDCWGFVIREKKKPRKIDMEKLAGKDIPAIFYERLKAGEDYITKSGERIANESVTIANTAAKSYGFCGDTIYNETICKHLNDITLLYHEATFLKDQEERAASRFHSTTIQAAKIAQTAKPKRLLIGHFSSKYEILDAFLEETVAVFPQTQLALEGVTYIIK
ncbi:ribonuclease Z [Panacibacter ginsenosidivorans]|uniref:Ribonuclease Z n=1 Tax=Panacibacter ginsenosidivorans TaxID=1813871 RepID=A0A5B8VFQ2_9BACT|nr:ribonuclease Z [Panacibacter ginsenosidivorans]QEC69376.1 ribonuclease Z [Panacibacter ginsenosidivorans]